MGTALVAACSLVGSDVDHFVGATGASDGGADVSGEATAEAGADSAADVRAESGGDGGSGCDPGLVWCQGACVDVSAAPLHCGACDTPCGPAQVCTAGRCETSCPVGQTECDRSCVDTQTDSDNCGDCAVSCGPSATCVAGSCATSCATGETQCGTACVDLQSDGQHCGRCGQACAVGRECSAGSCVVSCNGTQTECGGACVDTTSHVLHCGACDQPCDPGEVCTASRCELFCGGGTENCSGACTDLQNNNRNCGACGVVCDPGEVCSSGICALNCAVGQTPCGATCVDTSTTAAHCGGCNQPCAVDHVCVGGQCELSCEAGLNSPVTDPWGFAWDGLERPAATYATATATCGALGGRVPTATELFRVSATQSGTVGQTFNTNYLWSAVPYDVTRQHTLRLSDGATSTLAMTSTATYRCACPSNDDRKGFGGNFCHGPPGDECAALTTEGARYVMDKRDRASLSKGGAVWECAFHQAHLAPFPTYVEAILGGAANGSNVWLHTADEATYQWDTLVRWTGQPSTSWVVNGNMTGALTSDRRPFRCAGSSTETGTHPNTVMSEFVPGPNGYKSETSDTVTTGGATWAAAHDTCWDRGGHLPRSAELAELVQQGLPNGSNAWLFTSDMVGWNGTQFLAAVVRWTNEERRYPYWYQSHLTWAYKTNLNYPLRCIYYPLDASYGGPTAGDCSGGCVEFTLAGQTPAKMWLDAFDRVPASYEVAFETCRSKGGHLASERDLTEAIRHGLPNGSTSWNFTSDVGYGSSGMRAMIVRWTGVEMAFTDQYSTYSTWSDLPNTRAYRCMWSNELR